MVLNKTYPYRPQYALEELRRVESLLLEARGHLQEVQRFGEHDVSDYQSRLCDLHWQIRDLADSTPPPDGGKVMQMCDDCGCLLGDDDDRSEFDDNGRWVVLCLACDAACDRDDESE